MQTIATMIDSPTYGQFTFDAVFHTDHAAALAVTGHPVQTGASIADHAYMEPDEITAEIGMSDAAVDVSDGHSVNACARLRAIMESREPFTLITRLRTYPNTLITSISVPDDYTTMHALRASVRFQQIQMVSVSTVTVQQATSGSKSASSGGSKRKKTAAKTSGTASSTKSTTVADQSVLKRTLDALRR